ncbi:GumC family protein [Pseudooceanicola lipolyticus]|nr:GNVR domain-containing protein [Pseudooceanicola lipolyticus]
MSELQYYFSLFIRRLPIVVLVSALVSAVSVIVAIKLPPEFESHARLMVESSQIPDSLAPSTVQISSVERLQVIQNRLLTRPVLLDIAERFNALPNQSQMSPDEIVNAMRSRTGMRTSGGRNQATIMQITFEARTAEIAAGVLNEYVSLIQQEDVTIRTGSATDTLDFFDIEVRRLSEELSAQSEKILEFKKAHINALPDSLDFRQRQRSALQDRLEQAERDIYDLRTQRQQLIEIASAGGDAAAAGLPKSRTQIQLDETRTELQDALLVYSATNPKVRLLQARVGLLEEAVEQERASQEAEGTEETGNSALDLRLAEIDARVETLQGQIEGLNSRIEAVGRTIDETPENAIVLEDLQRGYNNLQQQYNTAVARQAEASTGEKIEVLSKGERVTIIDQPTVPSRPTKPNRMMIAGGGTFLGLMLGVAVVFLLELLNRAPRRPEDIIKKLGVWPMATIPYTRTRHDMIVQRSRKIALIIAILIVVPVGVWAIHEYYLPLDILAQKIMNRIGVRW